MLNDLASDRLDSSQKDLSKHHSLVLYLTGFFCIHPFSICVWFATSKQDGWWFCLHKVNHGPIAKLSIDFAEWLSTRLIFGRPTARDDFLYHVYCNMLTKRATIFLQMSHRNSSFLNHEARAWLLHHYYSASRRKVFRLATGVSRDSVPAHRLHGRAFKIHYGWP